MRRLARLEANGRAACRLLALANVLAGMSRDRAARQAGMDRQTLRDGLIRFNVEEVEGLRDRPKSGRPTRLDEGQLAAFKALVLRGPDPERDWRQQLVRQGVSAAAMQAMLDELSAAVTPGTHPVVLWIAPAGISPTTWPSRPT